jgi:predicted GNAT family acetyltransferase
MADEDAVEVVDDPTGERYVLRRGGEEVGEVAYRRVPDRTVLIHTEVDPERGGRGLGSRLVREALDAERDRGAVIEPRCPFVAHFIRKHPDYATLVHPGYRDLLAQDR